MEYEEFIEKLGKKIKEIRISQGITQESMEEGDNGISYRTVQDIENGQSHPSVRSLFKIAKRMNVTLSQIMAVESANSPKKYKPSNKDYKTLYQYFRNAETARNLLKKYENNAVLGKDELDIFLTIWFSYLYSIIDTAINSLDIREKPFNQIFDFKNNKWKNSLLVRLRESYISFSNFTNYSPSKEKKIDLLIRYTEHLHFEIALFFERKKLNNFEIQSSKMNLSLNVNLLVEKLKYPKNG